MLEVHDEVVAAGVLVLREPLGDPLRRTGERVSASFVPSGTGRDDAKAEADKVPLDIDGACCFNYAPKR